LIVLPRFQRNFVWDRDDISDLLISILQGHFIGSFLILEVDKENVPFDYRPLEGISVSADRRPEKMILDGQQRLTSLHYVFAAPDIPLKSTKYPYRFFMDLNNIASGDWENAFRSERTINCADMLDRSRQFETRIIPMTEFEKWEEWLNEYERWLVEKDQNYYLNTYFKEQRPLWSSAANQVRNFLVPTLTIPKIAPNNQNELAEICAIFEKINSMGVKLSVYDLLTARLYKDKIDLHRLWSEAIDEYHLLDQHSEGKSDDFGVFILRTIALFRGMDMKSKTLINLSPHNFENDWRKAAKYIEKALERMTLVGQDGFGAFNRKWIPYITMVSPLAGMLAAIDDRKFDHKAYKIMRRWYWSSVFRERYASSVESNIYRDYQEFLRCVSDKAFEMDALREARVNIIDNQAYSLRDVSRINSVYRGVMCLIALRGAKDFSADDSIQFHTLEDHHIFPVAYLKKQKDSTGKKISEDKINCVINRTLIADETNRRISKSNPSKYVRDLIPLDRVPEILSSHFIDETANDAMRKDEFDGFVVRRERALLDEIRKRVQSN